MKKIFLLIFLMFYFTQQLWGVCGPCSPYPELYYNSLSKTSITTSFESYYRATTNSKGLEAFATTYDNQKIQNELLKKLMEIKLHNTHLTNKINHNLQKLIEIKNLKIDSESLKVIDNLKTDFKENK
ncbi:hypothetical protein [Campylobacter sp. RM12651]|uniref:hypothetical protein n=1 Tax=Campylobacter sp. RM12651 TaxID=1660079 RepID=UPI001EFBC214|nr:hypothetical protein [Campylobacter sp. RM12651]ULO04491.1 hypothetical protein AVBRAN_a0009 [Campylobacter sp. RM12651]